MKTTLDYLLHLVTWALVSASATAQPVQVSVVLQPPYSPHYEDYLVYENKATIILAGAPNPDQSPYEVYLRARIEGDNGIRIQSKEGVRPGDILVVPAGGIVTLTGGDLEPYFSINQMDVEGIEVQDLLLGDGLPEGEYTICLQAFSFLDDSPLSLPEPAGCSVTFSVRHVDPPLITTPLCEQPVWAMDPQHLVITWTIPPTAAQLEYVLSLQEVFDGQDPNEVFLSGVYPPLFEVQTLMPSYIYGLADPELEPEKRYAIQVRAFDPSGTIVFKNNGFSEVCSFQYGSSGLPPADDEVPPEIIATPDVTTEPVANTRVRGKLQYVFPPDGGRTAGRRIQATQVQGIRYRDLLPAGSPNSAASNESPHYALAPANLSPGVFNPAVHEAMLFQRITNPFHPVVSDPRPLAHVPVQLVIQMVVEVDDEFDAGSGQHTSQAPAYRVLKNLPAENSPLQMKIGTVLASTVTDADGNFEFAYHQEDSIGTKLVQDLHYWSMQDWVAKLSLDDLCERMHTVPVDQDKGLGPGPLLNPSNKGIPFMQGFQGTLPEALLQGIRNSLKGQMLASLALASADKECDAPWSWLHVVRGHTVLRVVVGDRYYCSPDDDLFVQPGGDVDAGLMTAYVQRYDLRILAVTDDTRTQAAGRQKPLSEYDASVYRPAVSLGLLEHLPEGEGQGLQGVESGKRILAAFATNNSAGSTLVTRLVRHKTPADAYRLTISTPKPAMTQYKYRDVDKAWPDYNRGSSALAIPGILYNSEYVVQTFETVITMAPESPAFAGLMYSPVSNLGKFNLPGVRCSMTVEGKQGKEVIEGMASDVGFVWMEGKIPDEESVGGIPVIVGPKYTLVLSRPGYEARTLRYTLSPKDKPADGIPANSATDPASVVKLIRKLVAPGGDVEYPIPIWGEIKNITTTLQPLGSIRGYVVNEDGAAVHAQLRVEQGAYYETSPVLVPQPGQPPGQSKAGPGGWSGIGFELREQFTIQSARLEKAVVTIIPYGSEYLTTTVTVNTLGAVFGQPPLDLGPLVVSYRKHRPVIHVRSNGGQDPVAGAKVSVGEHVLFTDNTGVAGFSFLSAGSTFPIRIEAEGLVTYEGVLSNAPSAQEKHYTYDLDIGFEIRGSVTGGSGSIPLSHARVFLELGYNGNYAQVLEAFSDAQGKYVLKGVPPAIHPYTVRCAYSSMPGDPTYVGTQAQVTLHTKKDPVTGTFFPTIQDFHLEQMDGQLNTIWGFRVEIESMKTLAGKTAVSGAIVQLPANPNFVPLDPNARLAFQDLEVIAVNNPAGQKTWLPANSEFRTGVNKLPVKVYQAYTALLRPARKDPFETIGIYKISDDAGEVSGLVALDLSSFKTEHQFSGALALLDDEDHLSVPVFRSGQAYGYRTFRVANYLPSAAPGQAYAPVGPYFPSDPAYHVFNFAATADRKTSSMAGDGIRLHTILHTQIQDMNPADLRVDIGNLWITPSTIGLEPGTAGKFSFRLGQWQFDATEAWQFDYNNSYIRIPAGRLATAKLEVDLQDIIVRPKELWASGKNVSNVRMGGVADLTADPGTEIFLQYHTAYKQWALWYANQTGKPVGKLEILPSMDKPILVQDVLFLADNSKEEMIPVDGQSFMLHKQFPFKLEKNAIALGSDYINLKGMLDLGLPAVPWQGMTLHFTRTGPTIVKSVQQMSLNLLDLPGHVSFASTSEPQFGDHYFQVNGRIAIQSAKDSQMASMDMDGVFTRTQQVGEIRPVQDAWVALGTRGLRVKDGLMNVDFAANQWNEYWFDAEFEKFQAVAEPSKSRNHYVVKGAVAVDNGSVQVTNLPTGFGQMNLVYEFDKYRLRGGLSTPAIPLGPMLLTGAQVNMALDPDGLLLWGTGTLQTTPAGPLQCAAMIGSYDHLSEFPSALDEMVKYSYSKKLPAVLADNSLQGLYVLGSRKFVDESLSFPLKVGSVGVEAGGRLLAGAEVNFGMEFNQSIVQPEVSVGGLLYLDCMISLDVAVCQFCTGVKGIIDIAAKWQGGNFEAGFCGSQGFGIDICGIGFHKTAYLYGALSTSHADKLRVGANLSGCNIPGVNQEMHASNPCH